MRDTLQATIGLPYPPYLWRIVRQTAAIWAVARLILVAMFMLVIPPRTDLALDPSWTTRGFLILLAAALVWLDRRRSHSLLLHANLGESPLWFWILAVATAGALDLLIQALFKAV